MRSSGRLASRSTASYMACSIDGWSRSKVRSGVLQNNRSGSSTTPRAGPRRSARLAATSPARPGRAWRGTVCAAAAAGAVPRPSSGSSAPSASRRLATAARSAGTVSGSGSAPPDSASWPRSATGTIAAVARPWRVMSVTLPRSASSSSSAKRARASRMLACPDSMQSVYITGKSCTHLGAGTAPSRRPPLAARLRRRPGSGAPDRPLFGGGRRATVVRVPPDGSARNRYASISCSVETTKPARPGRRRRSGGRLRPARVAGLGHQGVVTAAVVHPEAEGPLTDLIRM